MSASPSSVPAAHYLSGLLTFLLGTIKANLVSTVLVPLAAAVAAYVVGLQMPAAYQAQASIRMGKVDGAESASLIGTIARINSFAFKEQVVQRMNVPATERLRFGRQIFSSLIAKQETPDTLALNVRAPTAQQAQEVVAVALALLGDEQRKILEPLQADTRELLASYDTMIDNLLVTRDSLADLVKEESKASADPAAAAMRRVWLVDLVTRNEQRLASARFERHGLATKLGAWRTYPPALLDMPYVVPGFAVARPITLAIFAGVVMFLIFFWRALHLAPEAARRN